MKKVLLICTGNTCRSVMAKALFTKLAKENNLDLEFDSAGISAMPGDPANSIAEQVMGEFDLDVTNHRSRRLHEQMLEQADIVFTMTTDQKDYILSIMPEAEGKVLTLKQYGLQENQEGKEKLSMNIVDPFGQSLEQYRLTAKELESVILKIIEKWQ